MTSQEIFDKVARHLLTQNAKSQETGSLSPLCLYRSPSGLACAAGCLIADEHYSKDLEFNNVQGAPGDCPVVRAIERSTGPLRQPQIDLISRLQKIHDRCEPSEWTRELHYLAALSQLSPATIDEMEVAKGA